MSSMGVSCSNAGIAELEEELTRTSMRPSDARQSSTARVASAGWLASTRTNSACDPTALAGRAATLLVAAQEGDAGDAGGRELPRRGEADARCAAGDRDRAVGQLANEHR